MMGNRIEKKKRVKNNSYKNTPNKPGFYWAKKDSSCGRYNLIVDVYGNIPYLRWNAWNTATLEVQTGSSEPDFVFGSKIIEPTEEIKLDRTLVDNFNTVASGLKNEIENEYLKALEEDNIRIKKDNILLKSKLILLRDELNNDVCRRKDGMNLKMKTTDEQWAKVKAYFDNVYAGYKERIVAPGVCVDYTNEYVLEPLLIRYQNGERSETLFNEMQSVE